MFGGLSKLITSGNQNLSNAGSIVKNVGKVTKRGNELAEKLGIIDGSYKLNNAPQLLQVRGSGEEHQSWFQIVTRPNSGGDGTSIKSSIPSLGSISDSPKVENLTSDKKNTNALIVLPYPQDIQISDSFQWSADERGIIANLGSPADDATLANIGNFAAEAATKAASAIAGNSLSKIIGFKRQEITNPHLASFFKGVDLRQIAFSFHMVPKSEDDVETILTAIDTFKYHAHPEASSTVTGGTSNRLKYPSEFAFKIISGDFTIIDMENCVVTKIDTNYTPEGVWAAYDDGFPIAIKLDISFMETRAKDRSNYDTITRG